MRIKLIVLVFSFISFIATPIFAGNYGDRNGNQYTRSQGQGQKTNRAILAWLVVLNKNEIAATELAFKKNGNSAVEKYARWLHQQHTRNLKETYSLAREIGEPMTTSLSVALKRDGQKEIASLRPLNKNNFDKAFIDGMVAGHREALAKLKSLMKDTNNPMLEKQLKKTYAMVSHHLKRGEQLQRKLGY